MAITAKANEPSWIEMSMDERSAHIRKLYAFQEHWSTSISRSQIKITVHAPQNAHSLEEIAEIFRQDPLLKNVEVLVDYQKLSDKEAERQEAVAEDREDIANFNGVLNYLKEYQETLDTGIIGVERKALDQCFAVIREALLIARDHWWQDPSWKDDPEYARSLQLLPKLEAITEELKNMKKDDGDDFGTPKAEDWLSEPTFSYYNIK